MTLPAVKVAYLDHVARWSGGEIALFRLIAELDRSEVEPLVILSEPGPLEERLRSINVEVLVVNLDDKVRDARKDTLLQGVLGKLVLLKGLYEYAHQLSVILRERGVQVIHANSLKADFIAWVAGRLAGIPVIWHVRDHIDPVYLPGPVVWLFRFLAGWLPDLILTNSESTLQKLQQPPGRKLNAKVLPDGLTDEEIFSVYPAPARKFIAPVKIGLIGRITRWKGQHVFLQAGRLVLDAGLDAQFLIIGSALFDEHEYEDQLQSIVSQLQLRDQVKFCGFQEDVPGVLADLDILVHASITPEPFGQVVIEGMASELPVVAAAGGGVLDIIQHKQNGLLHPMGDAETLAENLMLLLEDPRTAREMAMRGRQTVVQKFRIRQSAQMVTELYRQIAFP